MITTEGHKYNEKKKWPCKNLRPLADFLRECHGGLSVVEISARIGKTPQNVSMFFRKDDMKLSVAEKIAEAYGKQLRLYFPKKTYLPGLEPPVRKKDYPNAGNLQSLADYMLDSNYTVHSLATMTGCSYTTLKHAFETGDIMISALETITKELNIEYLWRFEDKCNN